MPPADLPRAVNRARRPPQRWQQPKELDPRDVLHAVIDTRANTELQEQVERAHTLDAQNLLNPEATKE